MSTSVDLINHFLIAMPNLDDPDFYHSVTYVCAHGEDGAMGITINQPTDLSLREVLEHMDIKVEDSSVNEVIVYRGGPVEGERGFILHRPLGNWEGTLAVTDEIGVTTSKDILEAIAKGEGPDQYLVALGYAGWGDGQLEDEIADNAWLSGPVDNEIMFSTPNKAKWESAANLIGVDLKRMSSDVGHA